MTRLMGCVVALALLPGVAVAQTTITPVCRPGACGSVPGWWPEPQAHTATGYPDLDRAVAICDAHTTPDVTATIPPSPPRYKPGYEACPQVMAKRDTTEQANREREAKAREETDRKFLAGFVERLAR